jgi:hypothetical protein
MCILKDHFLAFRDIIHDASSASFELCLLKVLSTENILI